MTFFLDGGSTWWYAHSVMINACIGSYRLIEKGTCIVIRVFYASQDTTLFPRWCRVWSATRQYSHKILYTSSFGPCAATHSNSCMFIVGHWCYWLQFLPQLIDARTSTFKSALQLSTTLDYLFSEVSFLPLKGLSFPKLQLILVLWSRLLMMKLMMER